MVVDEGPDMTALEPLVDMVPDGPSISTSGSSFLIIGAATTSVLMAIGIGSGSSIIGAGLANMTEGGARFSSFGGGGGGDGPKAITCTWILDLTNY